MAVLGSLGAQKPCWGLAFSKDLEGAEEQCPESC